MSTLTNHPPASSLDQVNPPEHDDHPVQMNVRVPCSMRTALDDRRRCLGISRDEWVRRVIEWALTQPLGTPVHPNGTTPMNGQP